MELMNNSVIEHLSLAPGLKVLPEVGRLEGEGGGLTRKRRIGVVPRSGRGEPSRLKGRARLRMEIVRRGEFGRNDPAVRSDGGANRESSAARKR